ncbi:MAG TPA: nucleotidyltransferase family protein, partial [Candidatus Bathyarchaeia archaeon]|nr:nucleotidyltransferase family protein [Candidatus Bathyarchaeia archaeon]
METPFGNDFLRVGWPLLLQSCALPRDPAKISALAAEVDDVESLFRLADEHGVIAHLAAALATDADARIPTILRDSLRTHRRLRLLLSLTLTAELFRILELFRKSQIECIVLKGPVLSLRAY